MVSLHIVKNGYKLMQACFIVGMLALLHASALAQTVENYYSTFDPHLSSSIPFADRGDIIFETGPYLIIGSGYLDFQNKRVTNLLKIDMENFEVVDSTEVSGPQGDQNFLAGMAGSDGYLYFTGEWGDYTVQRMRMFLAKYTTDLELVWINYFPEMDDPDFSYYAYDLCQAHDGDIMMIYNRQDFVTDPRALLDTRILRSDTAGNVVFNKLLPDTLWLSQGNGNISTVANQNYLVTTYSEQENGGELEDVIIHQVNETGDIVWTRVTDGSTYTWQPPKSIMLDNGGSAVAWIKDTLVDFENNDWFTRFFQINVYDESGDPSWSHTWWTKMNSGILDLHKAANGDILGCGYWNDFNGWIKSWIFRFSPGGELMWQRLYNDSINRPFAPNKAPLIFWQMTELVDGRLAITGYAIDSTNHPDSNVVNANVLLMVLDSTGCLSPGCQGETQIISSTDHWQIINTYPLSPLQLSPNPATSTVYIQWLNKPVTQGNKYTLTAFDCSGRFVWSGEWNGDPQTIDLSNWPVGLITIVALYKGQPVSSGKLLKVAK